MTRVRSLASRAALAAIFVLLSASAFAQAPGGDSPAAVVPDKLPGGTPAEAGGDSPAAAVPDAPDAPPVPGLDFQKGPMKGALGPHAEIDVPAGFMYLDAKGTRSLLELTENPSSGKELGTLAPEQGDWFVVFEFDPIGYVKDDDKDSLDASAMLEAFKEGTAEGNKQRQARGWQPIEIVGWHTPPAYNPTTNNLEWAIKGKAGVEDIVNFNTRLLGRRGVMEVTLVCDPAALDPTLAAYQKLLTGFSYKEGQKYAQYEEGDHIAEYGLAALVTGVGLAAAAKTGLLAKFWKVLVAIGAGIAALFGKLFGRRKKTEPPSP